MKVAVAVLAAGLGTRMKSRKPKVLHGVLGKPMISYVIDAVSKIKPERIIVVTNPSHTDVRNYLEKHDVETTIQRTPLGTADAVKTAFNAVGKFEGTVLIVNGDTPLIKGKTLKKFLTRHNNLRSDLSVLSFYVDNPSSYGRIVRDDRGEAQQIVEEKDLDLVQKEIKEVNSGIYAINHNVFGLISRIKVNKKKGEYYLTDILELGKKRGFRCNVISRGEKEEFYGINSLRDLQGVQSILQQDIIEGFMQKGVTFYDPDSVIVHPDVKIAQDAVIYPGVCLEGKTRIGSASVIYSGVRIVDSRIGKGVTVLDHSLIEFSRIAEQSTVGPFAHLRPKSILGKRVKIGNFVELKNATIADGTKANHLSYIGDAAVGKDVNIGAGTITCNYDGQKKHKTVIEDGVFVGSDTQFVAPVKVGKKAFIAAGSTITNDVPDGALAISRVRQQEIEGWKQKNRKGKKK